MLCTKAWKYQLVFLSMSRGKTSRILMLFVEVYSNRCPICVWDTCCQHLGMLRLLQFFHFLKRAAVVLGFILIVYVVVWIVLTLQFLRFLWSAPPRRLNIFPTTKNAAFCSAIGLLSPMTPLLYSFSSSSFVIVSVRLV